MDLCFVPFENQHSMRPQNAKALSESPAHIFAPVSTQLSILGRHPTSRPSPDKVGRIERYQGERPISKRKGSEVHLCIRMDMHGTRSVLSVGSISNNNCFVAMVTE